MTVRELVTTWGFDIDTKPLKELEERIHGVRETATHLFELIAGEGASLFGLAETTADAAVQFKKTSEEVGTTVTKIQELNYAAKIWDVQAGSMTIALRRLSMMAVEASNGSAQAARTLAQAGVNSIYGMNGQLLRSDQILAQIAAKFKTMPNNAQKAGLAGQIFGGRNGSEIMPILNRWDELQKVAAQGHALGGIISEEDVQRAVIFKESMNQLRAMMTGLRNTIGVALMPAVEDMVKTLIDWYQVNQEMIRQDIAKFANQLAQAVKGALDFVMKLANGVVWLVEKLGGLGNVLKIVTTAFVAWTTMGIVSSIGPMIKIVMDLTKALYALAVGEDIATGGLALIAQLAAGAGASALMWHMMAGGSKASESAPTPNGMSTPGFPAGLNIHVESHNEIYVPPGTTQQQATHIAEAAHAETTKLLQTMALSVSHPAAQ